MVVRRDGPDLKRDENGQVAEVRLPSRLSTAMSFLAVVGSVFLGVSLGGTFSQLIGNRYLIRETWMVSAARSRSSGGSGNVVFGLRITIG